MKISVVVATHDRATRLEALLRSLSAQSVRPDEVVVVDDGSRDLTPEVLRAAEQPHLVALRHERSVGPAAARNTGWRACSGELVAFIDDDCTADPGWLAALTAAHARDPDVLLQGRTEPDPAELERAGAFWRSVTIRGPDPLYQSCNIAYAREVLERLGGFDESFTRPFGEDTDLGWRARELGVGARFVSDALVHHAVYRVGVVGLLRDAARFPDQVRAVKQHPGIKADYLLGVFWHESHALLVLALAGAALARRTRGASVALAVPYARRCRRLHPGWAGALASLPGYAAIDLAQMLALAWGSARHRTLVL